MTQFHHQLRLCCSGHTELKLTFILSSDSGQEVLTHVITHSHSLVFIQKEHFHVCWKRRLTSVKMWFLLLRPRFMMNNYDEPLNFILAALSDQTWPWPTLWSMTRCLKKLICIRFAQMFTLYTCKKCQSLIHYAVTFTEHIQGNLFWFLRLHGFHLHHPPSFIGINLKIHYNSRPES